MNNPNPFIPQGSLLEQKNKKRARVKVAVFSIFTVNILVILPLLIQGCGNKEKAADETASLSAGSATNISSAPDTNTAPPSLPPVNSTSAPPAMTSNTLAVSTPPPPPPPPAPEVPATTEYVVLKGESFYTIAQKFHVKTKDLEAANPNVQPTKLKAGQKIQLPGGATGAGSTGGTAGTTAMPDSSGETTYVVKPKDTLTKVAKEFGTTVKALRSLNSLKSDAIKVGQKLKVPSKAAPVEPAPTPTPAPAAVSTPAVMPPPSAPPAGMTPGH
jgi:LysM repeat protein